MAKRKKLQVEQIVYSAPLDLRFSRLSAAENKVLYFDRNCIIKNKNNFILFFFFLLRHFNNDIKRILFLRFKFLRKFFLYKFKIVNYNLNFIFDYFYLVNDFVSLIPNFKSFCFLELSLERSPEIFKPLFFFRAVKRPFLIFDFFKLYIDLSSFFLLQHSLDFVKAIRYNEYIGTNLFFCRYIRTPLIKAYNDNSPRWWETMMFRSVINSYSKSLFYDNFIILRCFSDQQGLSISWEPLFMNVFFKSRLLRILIVAGISFPYRNAPKSLSRLALGRLILFFIRILQENPKGFTTAKSRYYMFYGIFLTLFGFAREMRRILGTFFQLWERLFYKLLFRDKPWLNASLLSSFFIDIRRTTNNWSLFDLLYERFFYITSNYYIDRGFSKNWLFKPYAKRKLTRRLKWYFTAKDKKDLNKVTNNIKLSLNKNKDNLISIVEERSVQQLQLLKIINKELNKAVYFYNKKIKMLKDEINFVKKDEIKILNKIEIINELKSFRIKTLNNFIDVLKGRLNDILKIILLLKRKVKILNKNVSLVWQEKHPIYFMQKDYNKQLNKIRGAEAFNIIQRKFLIFKLGTQNLLEDKHFIYSYIDFNWTEFNYLDFLFEDAAFFEYGPFIKDNSFILGKECLVSEVEDYDFKIIFLSYWNWVATCVDDIQNFFHYCLDHVSTFDRAVIDGLLLSRYISSINFFQKMYSYFSPVISENVPMSFINMLNHNDLILKILLTSNSLGMLVTLMELSYSEQLLNIVMFNDFGYIKHFLSYFYYLKFIVMDVPAWPKKQPPFLPSAVHYR